LIIYNFRAEIQGTGSRCEVRVSCVSECLVNKSCSKRCRVMLRVVENFAQGQERYQVKSNQIYLSR